MITFYEKSDFTKFIFIDISSKVFLNFIPMIFQSILLPTNFLLTIQQIYLFSIKFRWSFPLVIHKHYLCHCKPLVVSR